MSEPSNGGHHSKRSGNVSLVAMVDGGRAHVHLRFPDLFMCLSPDQVEKLAAGLRAIAEEARVGLGLVRIADRLGIPEARLQEIYSEMDPG